MTQWTTCEHIYAFMLFFFFQTIKLLSEKIPVVKTCDTIDEISMELSYYEPQKTAITPYVNGCEQHLLNDAELALLQAKVEGTVDDKKRFLMPY